MRRILLNLRALWRGELPLEFAFWHYAIYYGLILNLAASTISIVLLLNDAPLALALLVHFVPVPYSVLTAFGVWRSAHRYGGSSRFANFARIGVLAWVCLLLAI
ncbi:MAG: hypothetical protein HC861_03200 [Rhodospirillaceae bacterium]|nr:hypothetical protein [Rhodospirillaceae bacterium]